MSNTQTINRPLLYQVLGFLETHPEQWDQGNWARPAINEKGEVEEDPFACGAKGCFAGWASVFAGGRWAKDGSSVITPDNRRVSVQTHAMEALGLNDYQANLLFSGGNTIEQMKEYIKKFITPKKPQVQEITFRVKMTENQLGDFKDKVDNYLGENLPSGALVAYTTAKTVEVDSEETTQEQYDRFRSETNYTPCCSIIYDDACGIDHDKFEAWKNSQ